MKKTVIIIMLIIATTALSYDLGLVMRAVDGDTIKVMVGEEVETVRMLGVDTPESVHPTKPVEPGGIEASDFTKEFLTGKYVFLTYDAKKTDFFGRLLAYVWYIEEENGILKMKCYNKTLIERGFGELYTKYKFDLRWYFEEE